MKTKGSKFGSCIVTFIVALALLISATASVRAEDKVKAQGIVDNAKVTFNAFMNDKKHVWLKENFKTAKGVLIYPQVLKAGFIIGGSGGTGVFLVKDPKTGDWSHPAFYTLGSVSFGLQFGGQKSEAIILVMTQKGINSMQKTSFKLGGDLSVAAGPVGIGAQGATAPSLKVDYITFTRSMGAFVGISLDGAVINENYDWNKAYYGKPLRPEDILVAGGATNPNSAALRSAVAKAALSAP